MKTILSIHWRSEELIQNLGDYITAWILKQLGYSFLSFEKAIEQNRLSDFSTCLFGVGSLLGKDWFDYVNYPKTVIGSGYYGDEDFLKSGIYEKAEYLAVRGPLTRKSLGLSNNIPMGDLALLLPNFFFPKTVNFFDSGKVAYIPHFFSRDKLKFNVLDELGAEKIIDSSCFREEFESRIIDIANSEFILTSSLHGAIVAQAYNIPWAQVNPSFSDIDKPFKWLDWYYYLGLDSPLELPKNITEAKQWWQIHGSKGRVNNTNILLEVLLKYANSQSY